MGQSDTVGLRIFGLLWFLWTVTGCATTTHIVANKDPAFTEKLRHVYVVSHLSQLDPALGEQFPTAITHAFSQQGITCTVVTVSDVELDVNRYTKDIEASAADTILSLVPVQWRSRAEGGSPVSWTVDASLVHRRSRKRIWRAKIEMLMGSHPEQTLAVDIVQQLRTDGLL